MPLWRILVRDDLQINKRSMCLGSYLTRNKFQTMDLNYVYVPRQLCKLTSRDFVLYHVICKISIHWSLCYCAISGDKGRVNRSDNSLD